MPRPGYGLRGGHAGARQSIQRHEDIVPAFHGSGGDDGAGPVQQRKGKQQSREKLTGDIAGQMVLARLQRSPNREGAACLLTEDALLPEEVQVRALGAGPSGGPGR